MNSQSDIFLSSELSYPQFNMGQNNFQDQYSLFLESQQSSKNNGSIQYEQQIKQKRKRVNNTIFKTPLSEFRKMVIKELKKKHIETKRFDQITKKKNMSTFLKMLILVDHYGIKNQIKSVFSLQMRNLLNKKKNKIQSRRFQQLQRIIERMQNSFNANNFQEMVNTYWGKYRQKSKFEECVCQIKKFQLDLLN